MKLQTFELPDPAALRKVLRRSLESPSWVSIAFAVRTTAASLIALYIAFRMNLDDPKWAATTVWVVAQGNRGMSLSKSQYRILGTAVGAVVSLALVALFAQTPDLFVLALATWIGVCTGVATSSRNFRAYAGVLAGYTAAIIAVSAVSAPLHAFNIAVARFLYIVLGILVEATLTTLFAPGAPMREVREHLGRYLEQAANVCARTLRRDPDGAAIHRLFAGAMEFDTAAEYAAAASLTVRRRIGHLRAVAIAVLSQLATAQALSGQLAQRPDITDDLIEETARLLDKAATDPAGLTPAVAAMRSTVDSELLAEADASGDSCTPRLLVLNRLGLLLAALDEILIRTALLDRADAPPSRPDFAYHRDPVLAWHNGIRAFVAVLAASTFWILSAWPSGASFVTIVGVVSALFSTRPNSVTGALGFLKGAACAVLVAAVCNFVLLPAVSGFVLLAYIAGFFMVGTGLAMRNPRIAAIGSGFAIFFWNFISPDNSTRINDASFLNSALATLLGIAFSTAVFAILFPTDPKSIRVRLHRAVRRDLAEIARTPRKWNADAWLSRTADRLSRLLVIGSVVPRATRESDLRGLVAAWTIGDSLLAIHDFAAKHSTARRSVAAVLKRLHRADVTRLVSVCGAAARRLKRQGRELGDKDRRELLRGAILLQTIADTAKTHADSLRGR
ncbi:FUSC family protein [Paraburkholderia panacisoli]|uniref:FUSC family protein n=1 Tax=Paraburkholderia panacisoli TaxID=2603818 RepID=A0A5B0HLU9_9BURK|nr:FUSC family protein [Paraburkholderia panacisoli]KAA1016199.1 FUSC family protein [Paraburkholderia panacisoli]